MLPPSILELMFESNNPVTHSFELTRRPGHHAGGFPDRPCSGPRPIRSAITRPSACSAISRSDGRAGRRVVRPERSRIPCLAQLALSSP